MSEPLDDDQVQPEQAFGLVLQQHRRQAGLSQEQLGLESGLSRNYVGMVERGERSMSVGVLFRLARVLQVPPSEMVQEVEELLNAPR